MSTCWVRILPSLEGEEHLDPRSGDRYIHTRQGQREPTCCGQNKPLPNAGEQGALKVTSSLGRSRLSPRWEPQSGACLWASGRALHICSLPDRSPGPTLPCSPSESLSLILLPRTPGVWGGWTGRTAQLLLTDKNSTGSSPASTWFLVIMRDTRCRLGNTPQIPETGG